MRVFNKKGQNMAEYSILIALVVAAAIGIKTYVQRGVQARIRDESDALVNKIANDADVAKNWAAISSADATLSPQFEPGEFSKKATTETKDTTDYTLEKVGTTSEEITKKTKGAAGDYEQHGYTKE